MPSFFFGLPTPRPETWFIEAKPNHNDLAFRKLQKSVTFLTNELGYDINHETKQRCWLTLSLN